MTALRHRGAVRRRGVTASPWLLAPLVLSAGFGILSGVSPKYGVLAALGLGFVVAVFADLVLGLAIFATLSFLDVLTIGGAAVSFDKVAGLLLFTSWVIGRTTSPRELSRDVLARHPAMFASIAAFVAWTAISAVWAFNSGTAIETAYRDSLDFLLIAIVYNAVRHRRDVHAIVIGYLIGAGFSVIYGLAHPASSMSLAAGRLVGSLGEANQQATVLVAGLALAMGLAITAKKSPRIKAVAIAASVLSVIGLLTTLSRAGLIAFGFVLIAGVVVGGRWRRPAAMALVAGAVLVTGYFVALAPPSAVHRVTSGDTSGRNDIWKVGWRMFAANPVLGVGAGNFEQVSARYLQRPGLVTSADFFIVSPKVAQNVYLEQLATLGLPGLILMMGIFIAGLASALRAAHIFERLGDRELELMSRCVILALIAFLAADFFASELLSKQLWLVFALGPALLKLAHNQLREAAV